MKLNNYLLKTLCFFFFLFSNISIAQDWNLLGVDGFSDGQTLDTEISIDNNGVPYVIFKDNYNLNKATVMKYDGTSWVYVGGTAGISHTSVTNVDISIDTNNIVYIMYKSTSSDISNNKLTVMKFNGTAWVNVGTPGFQQIDDNGRLAINKITNKPYVAYRDYTSGKGNVKMFNDTAWVNVGISDFSINYVGAIDLTISNTGIPYVTFRDDYTYNYKATVMKFNGANWELIGLRGLSTGRTGLLDITISDNGTPYIAYTNDDNFNLPAVMKFDGTAWSLVGPPALSNQETSYPRIKTYNNIPYIAYQDSNIWVNQVKKFDGTNWVNVGTPSLNSYNGSQVLAISNNGKVYCAGRNNSGKEKVTFLDTALSVSEQIYNNISSVYPNPSNNTSNVVLGKNYENTLVEIYNISGSLIQTFTHKNINEFSINTSEFAKGVYLINIKSDNDNSTLKLIVE